MQRLARTALLTSPASAALICTLLFNVMLMHPSVRLLINRPIDADALARVAHLSPAASGSEIGKWADPYVEEEEMPEESGAIRSCLWEVMRPCMCELSLKMSAKL